VVEAFRAAVVLRFRAVAAFFPAATRFGDFRVVLLRAVVRFRVVEAFRAAVDLRGRVVCCSVATPSIDPPRGIAVRSDRGVGRSHAGISGCQEGSGLLGASRELPSSTSFASSALSDAGSSASFQGQSLVVRSSDDGMTTSSARGSPVPLPELARKDARGVRRG
jgi:hypothetical protein